MDETPIKRRGMAHAQDRDTAVLSRDQVARLTARHGELRAAIAALNRTINTDAALRKRLTRERRWETWLAETLAERDRLTREYNAISDLLSAHIEVRRAEGRARKAAQTNDSLAQALRTVQLGYEQLMEAMGNEWTEPRRAHMRTLIDVRELLPTLVRRAELTAAQEQHEQALTALRREHQGVVEVLQQQIRALQALRSRPHDTLERLYASRYVELDPARTGRGITHRIDLRAEDSAAIEAALAGREET